MYGIKIGDDFLDIDADSSFNMTMSNPIFDKDSIARLFSFPFRCKDTAKNKRLLGQLDRLDSSSTNFQIDAQLWITGMPFKFGVVKVTGAGNNYIQIRFENKEQDLLEDLETININEILETINVPFSGTAVIVFDFDTIAPGTYQGQYYIQIDDNIYSRYQSVPTMGSEVSDYFKNAINADYPGFASSTTISQLKLGINLYPTADIHYDTLQGLTLTSGSNIAQDKLDSFHAYITDINNNPVASHAFPVIHNPSFYGGENSAYQQYVNFWSNGSFIENIPEDEEVWNHTFVPMVKLAYIFSKIIEQTSLTDIEGTFYDLTDTQNLLIYNIYALDEVTYTDFPGGLKYLNHYKQAFSLNDHVPDMTGKAILSLFLEAFQLYAELDGNKLLILKKQDQINKVPIDWSAKADPQYNSTIKERKGFTLTLSEDDNDLNSSSSQLQPYVTGAGENQVTISYGSLIDQLMTSTTPITHSWKVPRVLQKGTSDAGKLGKSSYTFRLLHFRGLQEDSNGDDYPMCQHGHTAYDDSDIGNYSLALEGDKGLYNQNYKGVIELQEKDTISMIMRLTFQDIVELSKWRNSKRYIYTEKGNFLGIIKSVQFKVSMQGISFAKVELIKL